MYKIRESYCILLNERSNMKIDFRSSKRSRFTRKYIKTSCFEFFVTFFAIEPIEENDPNFNFAKYFIFADSYSGCRNQR